MNYQPIKPQRGYEIVMQQLKAKIEAGELPPGEKLPSVVDLAVQFGVGRSTIREALSALKAMGWVTIVQGGGTFVSKELPQERPEGEGAGFFYPAHSLREVLEVRKFMEAGCATLAAKNRTLEDLQQLADIIAYMRKHVADEERSEQADVRFHLAIARATHNSVLLQMIESMTERLHASMKESRRLSFYGATEKSALLLQEHIELYEAIMDGDEQLASTLMLRHITKVEAVLLKLL